MQFSPNYPNFEKDIKEATEVKVALGTITMLSPTIGVTSRHFFNDTVSDYFISYIKGSFCSEIDGIF